MDNKLRYFIITAGVGILIFIIYHFLIYNKMKDQIKKLESKYSKISKELQTARIAAARLPELEIEIKKLQYLWEKVLKLLPPEEKPEEVITLLQQRGTQNNVKILKLSRNPPVSKGEYTELPYSLEVISSFHDLVNFISELSTLSRLVTVEGIKIDQSKSEDKSCGAFFVAKFYTVSTIEGAEIPKETGPHKPKRR